MTNPTEAGKKKVLVVDDDRDLREVLADKLTASGFEATQAVDGEDGLKKALEIHPDVTLLDVMMPKMNGWQMLDALRKDSWGKGAKVIMLTVLEDMDNVAQAVEKNSAGYLVKTSQSLDGIVFRLKEMMAENKI
jgi:DNA-binding response OmpR family regulator